MSLDLTQTEADTLIGMPKRPSSGTINIFPSPGDRLIIELESLDKTEDFLLDVTRGRIDLVKITYQHRARQSVILLRLDVHGAPHRNPDGVSVLCPHLHVYREGFGDKWAFPADVADFSNLLNQQQTLFDFMSRCNVTEVIPLQTGLF